MTPDGQPGQSKSEPIQPWDSDHTALVHVLWEIRRDGLTLESADEVAARIVCSHWMRAVRAHAKESRFD